MGANARDLAVRALRDRAGNVSARINRLLGEAELPAEERNLARELALGAVRRRGTLRAILRAYLRRPGKGLQPPVREILHVALHQLLFLQRVPAFAAVDEAVKQARRFGRGRASGLINGLLRAISRELSAVEPGRPPFGRDVVPVAPGSFRRLGREIFPDPQQEAPGYLAAAYSLPPSLAERWVRQFGSLPAAADVALHANARAPIVLRVNPLRADVGTVLSALDGNGVEAEPHANGLSVVLARHVDVRNLKAFQQGLVQPQDPSSTAVVSAMDVAPGMRVLDFCAAPGTKTTHLAERMGGQGQIVAADVSAEKLARIEENATRMGMGIVTPCLADQVGTLPPESFDAVLVDAPCSNTGVLARRAEARWRFDLEALGRLTEDQRFLLRAAERFVRPGGQLTYSTCSLEPEECAEMAHWVAEQAPHLALAAEQVIRPTGADDPPQWRDGGYYAIFGKHRQARGDAGL